jgi:glycosyltransferase involved in cell wall biosynthesis
VATPSRSARHRVLFFGKDASRGGTMRILSYVLRYLDRERFEPAVVLRSGGVLLPEYREHAAVHVFDEFAAGSRLARFAGGRGFPKRLRRAAGRGLERRENVRGSRWVASILDDFRPDLIVHNYNTRIRIFDGVAGFRPSVQCLTLYGLSLALFGEDESERIVRRAGHIMVEGTNVRDFLHGCVGVPLQDMSICCMGIDRTIRDAQLALPGRVTRADLGLGADDIVLVSCGTPNFIKGLDIWLRAAAILKERHPDLPLKFLWIGGTPARFGTLYARSCFCLTKELGLEDDVVYAGDQLVVYPYYDLADIYTQPSRLDAFPHAILEAMSLGKPAVSFREGVAAEEYAEGAVIGVDRMDARGLADGITLLLEDPDLRRRIGAAGRKLVRERFAAEKTIRDYEQVLLRQIGERR